MSNKLVFPQVAVYTPSEHDSLGLTKLELYAAMAMQGIVSTGGGIYISSAEAASVAVDIAVALVKEIESRYED